jgi:hypothetical protein
VAYLGVIDDSTEVVDASGKKIEVDDTVIEQTTDEVNDEEVE